MSLIANLCVLGVALLHVYILYLEMFAWERPRTRASFGTTETFARETKTLAANQGLYNGFLAAGLMWAILASRVDVAVFFLVCVGVAGLYGAATASRRILFIQTVPAAISLAAVLLT